MTQPMAQDDLVVWRPEGLYCPAGDFHIDPWRPVDRAVLTHAHADHARAGHRHVLASAPSEHVLRARLGAQLPLQTLAYGEVVEHRGVRLSLHPAGHVLGSAQVRLEAGGQVWVASGDYLLSAHDEAQPTCAPFEPVRCDVFITESTFGLPVYRWAPQAETAAQIHAWWAANAVQGRPSLLLGYSFGKAQRLLAALDPAIGPIRVHEAVATMNAACRAGGMVLPEAPVLPARPDRRALAGALLLAPPALQDSAWSRRLGDPAVAFASGWMAVRGQRRRRGVDRGFVLSDHADWPGLQRAIRATGASRVIVTHGYEAELVRWLQSQGLQAASFGAVGWSEDAQDDALAVPAVAAAAHTLLPPTA
ncbi:ligase-associated DNA damage response exonuclease [Pseudaquabacterium rugosum]|uniref:Ligase-associated DNA damage response exonuclease n=1 Tax=Pseudaquabacterium rugosum TaxID=2984194 RepID=A0ABU9B9B3_9BURK